MSACECAACGEHFTGVRAFDLHQRPDYRASSVACVPPAALGMVRSRHDRWAFPPDPDKPNPWAVAARSDAWRGGGNIVGPYPGSEDC